MVLKMSDNPLVEYFRRPALYITLPSKGKFYPEGTLNVPESGEIPVYPMTAIDEITYRTPDALFNGTATAEIIQSCVPAIKNAWLIPGIDITPILTAIRIASSGKMMDITTECPKCEARDDYEIDLSEVLAQIGSPDYDRPMVVGDLEIFFKPLTYADVNRNNKISIEENRLLDMLKNSDSDEKEKITLLADAFKKVSAITVETIVKNIDYIITPNAKVDQPEFIHEFITKCDNNIFKDIKKYIVQQRVVSDTKPVKIKCDNCGHEYLQPYTLDMSNFFEQDS